MSSAFSSPSLPKQGQCVQVHGKRFAVLTKLIDEIEASLNAEEADVIVHNKVGTGEQSDRDSSEHSTQD